MTRFRDRQEAGRLLAKALEKYKGEPAVVYALPRGGVVLGAEIARELGADMDLVIPRKVGHPTNPEYAVCAVTEDGYLVCNQAEAERLDPEWLKEEVLRQRAEAIRRRKRYLADRSPVTAAGRTAIITDDGVATGLTMLAAIEEVKDRGAGRIVVAVPVMPADIARLLAEQGVDEIVALDIPDNFMGAVGAYYDQFDQVEDEQVVDLMDSMQKIKERRSV
jgi:predicted phosphoribosyltransferase